MLSSKVEDVWPCTHDQPLLTLHGRHKPVSVWDKCHAGTGVHTQRTLGNIIPCLAKQAGKSVSEFWEQGCLGPSAIQWKPVLILNPASKAGQSRHPATSSSLHSMLPLQEVAKMYSERPASFLSLKAFCHVWHWATEWDAPGLLKTAYAVVSRSSSSPSLLQKWEARG